MSSMPLGNRASKVLGAKLEGVVISELRMPRVLQVGETADFQPLVRNT